MGKNKSIIKKEIEKNSEKPKKMSRVAWAEIHDGKEVCLRNNKNIEDKFSCKENKINIVIEQNLSLSKTEEMYFEEVKNFVFSHPIIDYKQFVSVRGSLLKYENFYLKFGNSPTIIFSEDYFSRDNTSIDSIGRKDNRNSTDLACYIVNEYQYIKDKYTRDYYYQITIKYQDNTIVFKNYVTLWYHQRLLHAFLQAEDNSVFELELTYKGEVIGKIQFNMYSDLKLHKGIRHNITNPNKSIEDLFLNGNFLKNFKLTEEETKKFFGLLPDFFGAECLKNYLSDIFLDKKNSLENYSKLFRQIFYEFGMNYEYFIQQINNKQIIFDVNFPHLQYGNYSIEIQDQLKKNSKYVKSEINDYNGYFYDKNNYYINQKYIAFSGLNF